MTCNFVCTDWAVIERTRTNFKVRLEEEEWDIYVSKEQVDEVSRETKQDENLVAVLLAYVAFIKQSTKTKTEHLKRLSDEQKLDGMIRLLNAYEFPIETLINVVRELKWHQLRDVLLARTPAQYLSEIT